MKKNLVYVGAALVGMMLGGPIIAILAILIVFLVTHDFTPKKK